MKPTFFKNASDFREWLVKHHETENELQVGFYKKKSGKEGITYEESVEQALCFGWIDGITHGIDELSYMIRFTPRRAKSNWSATNIRIVERLKKEGLMEPAGDKAYQARTDAKSAVYSYEQKKDPQLASEYEKIFKANKKAWDFFQQQAAWYKKTITHWIMTAKHEDTKQKRLTQVISMSEQAKRLQ